jgi:hypothetical protein
VQPPALRFPALPLRCRPIVFRYRPLIFAYVLFMGAVTVGECLNEIGTQDGWRLGDWLINYHAGFVRRGLPGEIALRLAHGLHLPSPVLVVVLAQIVCYGILFWAIDRLLRPTRLDFWTLACVLSPATLAFQFLVTGGGFRKEILLLAGLSALILWMRKASVPRPGLVVFLSVFGVVCALSHEGLIAYLPYVVAALVIGLESVTEALQVSAIPAVLTLIAGAVALHFRGDMQTVQGVCSALGYRITDPLPEMCFGAIRQLSFSREYAHADMLRYVHYGHFLRIYGILTPLALLAPAMELRAIRRRGQEERGVRAVVVCALVACLLSGPLFWVASDWGRWIYIHVMCLFLLVLQMEWKRQAAGVASLPVAEPVTGRRPRALGYAFLVLYATTWILPFTGPLRWPWGYEQMLVLSLHKDAPEAR